MGLKADLEQVRIRAQELLRLGETRDLTEAELKEAQQLGEKATSLKAALDRSEASQRQLRTIENLGGPIRDDEVLDMPPGSGHKTPWRGGTPHPWRGKVLAAASRGSKDFAPGGVTVPSMLPQPAELGQPPTTLLALLPRMNLSDSDQFAFLQQINADNQADIVEPGEEKPLSDYQFDLVEDRAVIIAHLAGPYNRFWFQDFSRLDQVLGSQMAAGVERKVEAYCISQLQAAATQAPAGELVQSVREAIAALELIGVTPNAVVLNPEDSAAVDLMRDYSGAFFGAGPFGVGPNTLWGLARVSSAGMPKGQALLADFRQTLLVERGQVELTWSDSVGENFQRNLLTWRAEQRVGFAVLQPPAVVKLDASDIGTAPEPLRASPSPQSSQPRAQPASTSTTSPRPKP